MTQDRMGIAVTQTTRQQRLLQEVVGGARHLIHADAAFLALLTADRQMLRIVVGDGLAGRLWRDLELPVAKAAGRAALADRKPFVIADLVQECGDLPECLAAVHEESLVSALAAPFTLDGEPQGVLYVANRRPVRFAERDSELLQVFARQAAIAVENARLLEAAEAERGRLLALVESCPGAVMLLEAPTGRVLVANRKAEELLGRPLKPELPLAEAPAYYQLYRPDGTLCPPEELPSSRALRGEDVTEVELAIRQPSGREVPTLAHAAPVRDASGRVTAGVVAFQDISGLKAAERRREAIGRAAAAVAAEPDLGPLLQVVLEQTQAILGADVAAVYEASLEAREVRLLVHCGLPSPVVERLRTVPLDSPLFVARAARDGQVECVEEKTQDAEVVRILGPELVQEHWHQSALAAPLIAKGRLFGSLYCGYRTPHHFAEAELTLARTLADLFSVGLAAARLREQVAAERARLQAVLASSPNTIILVESETRRVWANARAEELFGLKSVPEAGVEQYCAHLRWPDGRPMTPSELPVHRALSGEAVFGLELMVVRPDGRQLSVLVGMAPVRDAQGKVTGAVVELQDITSIKESERLREEFTSVVAHDLRTSVTVIQGFGDFLKRDADARGAPTPVLRGLENIRTSARRLNKMVSDLLDVSRIESKRLKLEKQAIDLAALVPEVVERVAEITKGHPVVVKVEQPIPVVQADPSRVEQILTNLLSNAAKYSPWGREIVVRVAPSDDRELSVSVADQGIGIPPEDVPELFTRFHRTSLARRGGVSGLGLGLYITKGLVEAHGWRIWVESKVGQGSTFTFALPVGDRT